MVVVIFLRLFLQTYFNFDSNHKANVNMYKIMLERRFDVLVFALTQKHIATMLKQCITLVGTPTVTPVHSD